jgi:hypothetical protein
MRPDLHGPLEQPGVRTRVIRALARGSHPAAIAREHGVSPATVDAFAQRHAERIADLRARMATWTGRTPTP